jgi:predicted ATPase
MRIESFEIRNYKGVEYAELSGLANQSVVMISGRNGTGKSLILEALVNAWVGRYSLSERTGPWGDDLTIKMSVTLTEDELGHVNDWLNRQGQPPALMQESYSFEVSASRYTGHMNVPYESVTATLRSEGFRREHGFARLDFLPANRTVSIGPSPTVNLSLLRNDQADEERINLLDQTINYRHAMNLPGVADYLVTLDYQSYLAERQGLQLEDEYSRLAIPFKAATGKTLLQPEYHPERGSDIEIELSGGQRHGLGDLSSGEQEMLAMMYFVRRLSAAGGILCLDEPEQHLHPTLQAALLDTMRDLADRAQVLVVSHSVNLIAAAPPAGLVQVSAPSGDGGNQVARLEDHPDKLALVADLGISPADLLQHDIVLVVEGESDAQWLRLLFPVELGRAFVIVAGSARQVISAYDTLHKSPASTPWLCLRDRDMMTDEAVGESKINRPRLHIWPRRAIESLLLDGALMSAVMKTVGVDIEPAAVEAHMEAVANGLQDEALTAFVEADLTRRYPTPGSISGGDRYDKMEAQMRAYAQMNIDRADVLASVLATQRAALAGRWATDWKQLVEPKAVLAQTGSRLGSFKSVEDLKRALFVRCREDAQLRPQAFEDFRLALVSALAEGAPQARP